MSKESNTKKNYVVIKRKNTEELVYFEYSKINGYSVAPKKNVKLKDGINVDKMVIINQSFIDKLINRKINAKFKELLTYINFIYDDTEDSGTTLREALNEIERFRRILYNKYNSYLSKERMDEIEKKIAILENEVKLCLYNFNDINLVEKETRRSR